MVLNRLVLRSVKPAYVDDGKDRLFLTVLFVGNLGPGVRSE